jgi:hypothetical protein
MAIVGQDSNEHAWRARVRAATISASVGIPRRWRRPRTLFAGYMRGAWRCGR